jgi:hypothetical protein
VHEVRGIAANRYEVLISPNLLRVNRKIGLKIFSEKNKGTEVYLIL